MRCCSDFNVEQTTSYKRPNPLVTAAVTAADPASMQGPVATNAKLAILTFANGAQRSRWSEILRPCNLFIQVFPATPFKPRFHAFQRQC